MQRLLVPTTVLACLLVLAGSGGAGAQNRLEKPAKPGPHVVVGQATYFDVSPPLRLITPVELPDRGFREIPEPEATPPLHGKGPPRFKPDPVLQASAGQQPGPLAGPQFPGTGNLANGTPPDPNGDIGTDHYIQMVNLHTAIYMKNGTLVWGPHPTNTIWSGFVDLNGKTYCQDTNSGDPIVVWDPLAKRWLVSQFAMPNFPAGPYFECIAISKTPDPTGPWYRYAFETSTKWGDYPHFGVWPDGYYMSTNQWEWVSGTSSAPVFGFKGAGATVFDRAKMLVGDQTAEFQYFDLGANNSSSSYSGMLPSDLDGRAPPPAGSPNYFAEVDDGNWVAGGDALRIWEFHVDWTPPHTGTTFGGVQYAPNAILSVALFNPLFTLVGSNWMPVQVPQPSTAMKLDPHGRGLLFRLAYRNHGGYEALVVNHAVDAGSGRAGVRWYEIRDPGGTLPTIQHQSTWAGGIGDTLYRFMGSIAQDGAGNAALAYSAGNSSTFPSILRTGRFANDSTNLMTMAETTIVAGGGSQTGKDRWGDYTDMTVDPIDDCTFWYTNEYYSATSLTSWKTDISSFSYPPPSSALLLTWVEEGELFEVDWLVAGSAAAVPALEDGLKE